MSQFSPFRDVLEEHQTSTSGVEKVNTEIQGEFANISLEVKQGKGQNPLAEKAIILR